MTRAEMNAYTAALSARVGAASRQQRMTAEALLVRCRSVLQTCLNDTTEDIARADRREVIARLIRDIAEIA